MFEFLGELEEVAGDLYPYRWPITAGLAVAAAALAAVAYRLGWHRAVWRRRLLASAIAAPVLAVALPVGWYTLSPLWERSRLDEASPLVVATPGADGQSTPDGAGATPDAGDPTSAPAFEPRVTHRGMFMGADDFHFGRGDALLIETAPEMFTLRFENFSVRNGPDLFVYLTDDPEDVSDAINLGGLKATDGNFNYEVPDGTDLSRYRYAVVWCRQFAVLFASAPLDAA